MQSMADLAVAVVGLLHLAFLILESFLWTRPVGRRVFRLSREKAEATRLLAANQGLYNGFLAAGLFFGLLHPVAGWSIQVFFLVCVVVAGLVGAITTRSRGILLVQAVPGLVALALVIATR